MQASGGVNWAREREGGREMENITASEIAGFGVGTLLLCATIAAPRVDSFISASQRRSLLLLALS